MNAGESLAQGSEDKGVFARLSALLSAIGTAWIFALMLLICADILGRDLFKLPILGVAEMVQFSIVGIVFLQLPQTLRGAGLTRSDVLLAGILRRWPRGGRAMTALFDVTGALLFAAIFLATLPLAAAAWTNGEFYGAIGVVQIPIWPLKGLILVGCAFMTAQFLAHAWRDAGSALRRGPT
ncbi:MAG: TRAP transporter small permease [Burkholderiales bacterium]|nr:TRAP transporter small permease [Burkholderiales bacterium]